MIARRGAIVFVSKSSIWADFERVYSFAIDVVAQGSSASTWSLIVHKHFPRVSDLEDT
jgi:hypothetical protein